MNKTLLSLVSLLWLFMCACHTDRVRPLPPLPPLQGDQQPVPATPPEAKTETVARITPPEPTLTETPAITTPPEPLVTLFSRLIDAYFDYDQDGLRPDAQTALRSDSALLKEILAAQPDETLVVEGHCDEHGSAEYNLALGARRAEMAKDFLVNMGVPDKSLRTVSYGKERPQCTDETEKCWQKNRRAHLASGE